MCRGKEKLEAERGKGDYNFQVRSGNCQFLQATRQTSPTVPVTLSETEASEYHMKTHFPEAVGGRCEKLGACLRGKSAEVQADQDCG